jgi:hypothetical protein
VNTWWVSCPDCAAPRAHDVCLRTTRCFTLWLVICVVVETLAGCSCYDRPVLTRHAHSLITPHVGLSHDVSTSTRREMEQEPNEDAWLSNQPIARVLRRQQRLATQTNCVVCSPLPTASATQPLRGTSRRARVVMPRQVMIVVMMMSHCTTPPTWPTRPTNRPGWRTCIPLRITRASRGTLQHCGDARCTRWRLRWRTCHTASRFGLCTCKRRPSQSHRSHHCCDVIPCRSSRATVPILQLTSLSAVSLILSPLAP